MKYISPQSIAAYDRLVKSGKLSDDQKRVYMAIKDAGERGVSVKELASLWGCASNEISGRFTELKKNYDCITQIDRRQGAGVYAICVPFNDQVNENIRGYQEEYMKHRHTVEPTALQIDGGLPF